VLFAFSSSLLRTSTSAVDISVDHDTLDSPGRITIIANSHAIDI
jgi:hypothetical protein